MNQNMLIGLAVLVGLGLFLHSQNEAQNPKTAKDIFDDRFSDKFGAGFPFD